MSKQGQTHQPAVKSFKHGVSPAEAHTTHQHNSKPCVAPLDRHANNGPDTLALLRPVTDNCLLHKHPGDLGLIRLGKVGCNDAATLLS
jgi:hypothetical protein